MNEDRYLRTGDVARLLHVSTGTVDRYAEDGKLPCIRTLGRHRRFDPVIVAELVKNLDHTDDRGND